MKKVNLALICIVIIGTSMFVGCTKNTNNQNGNTPSQKPITSQLPNSEKKPEPSASPKVSEAPKASDLPKASVAPTASEAPKSNDEANNTSYENINKMLVSMKSYASQCDVTYINNNKNSTYNVLQYSKADGEYRVEVTGPKEVAGNTTLYDGKTIAQYNKNGKNDVKLSTADTSERVEIFLTSFIKNYVNSDNVSVSVGSFGNRKCTILEAIVPGTHPYLASEKLWIDNKTMTPDKLVIYDYNGSERIVVTYDKFVLNPTLKEEIFKMPEQQQ